MRKIPDGLVCHNKANICGVEFTSGQPIDGGTTGRCGSVLTCVIGGRSVYGKVVKFFSHICDHINGLYAFVD